MKHLNAIQAAKLEAIKGAYSPEAALIDFEVSRLHERLTLSNGLDKEAAEILALLTAQNLDDTDRARGEFLGGCGRPQWHHCKNKGKDTAIIDADKHGEQSYLERLILQASVDEHQTGIEQNGLYNVRQLAHWKGGFKPELYAKFCLRMAAKRASTGLKIDRRRVVSAEGLERKEARHTMSNKDYQKWVRRSKKARK